MAEPVPADEGPPPPTPPQTVPDPPVPALPDPPLAPLTDPPLAPLARPPSPPLPHPPPAPATAPVPWRTILATIGAAAGTYVLWLLVQAVRREITWLIVAGFFAVILSPPVDVLVRRLKLRRTLAALIVFVVGFAAIGGFGYLLIQPIVTQGTKFVNQFPQLVKDAQAGRGPVGHLVKKYDLVNKAQQYAPKVQKYLSSSGSQAVTILRKIGNGVVSALTILVLTFLMLVEGPRTLSSAVALFRPERQERLKGLGRDSSRAITGYMAGNLLISLVAALVTYAGLWAFGVPFREVAAVWVGFADLIPLIGATLGAVPTVGLAFLHSVPAGIGMIILYIVYQQFENHVLQVTIMARTVKLSPLAVLVSLLIGVQLFGLLGALLAIPAAGILHVISVDVYRERQRNKAETALPGAGLAEPGPAGLNPPSGDPPDATA
jgi:predicted PurR-regulated permease PerM